MTLRRIRLAGVAATALLAAVTLAGCTFGDGGKDDGSSLSSQYQGVKSSGSGYVSGDGSVVTLDAAKRSPAPDWSSTTIDGDDVSSAASLGKVVVLNFWYAGCPPCRQEAPTLAKLYGELAPKGVEFVGVNTRDTKVVAQGFLNKYDLGYSTTLDDGDNRMQLAFASGQLTATAVPTTIVLDKKGRVAARFSGDIQSPSVLIDVVEDLESES